MILASTPTIAWLIVPVASAGFCLVTASEKGRNRWLWGAFGFFLPLIAVILVLSVPKRGSKSFA